jgi:hypothetical protein
MTGLRSLAHIRLPRHFWAVAAIVWVATAVIMLPMCGAMFSCGCTLLTAAKYCNIHNPVGPHCPWCQSHAWAAVVFVAMLAAGGLGVWGGLARWRLQGWRRLLAGIGLGVGTAFVLGSLCGLIMAVALDYPTWWGIRVFYRGVEIHSPG